MLITWHLLTLNQTTNLLLRIYIIATGYSDTSATDHI